MGHIYRFATDVIAYIGEEDPIAREAFRAMKGNTRTSGRGSLHSLSRRPWFHRLWPVQEVLHAKQITLVCGSLHASWDSLWNLSSNIIGSTRAGSTYLQGNLLSLRRWYQGQPTERPDSIKIVQEDGRKSIELPNVGRLDWSQLLPLMKAASQLECRNPIDNFFALQSLFWAHKRNVLHYDSKVRIQPWCEAISSFLASEDFTISPLQLRTLFVGYANGGGVDSKQTNNVLSDKTKEAIASQVPNEYTLRRARTFEETMKRLVETGHTVEQARTLGEATARWIQAGYTPEQVRMLEEGVTRLVRAGYSVQQALAFQDGTTRLLQAGYTVQRAQTLVKDLLERVGPEYTITQARLLVQHRMDQLRVKESRGDQDTSDSSDEEESSDSSVADDSEDSDEED